MYGPLNTQSNNKRKIYKVNLRLLVEPLQSIKYKQIAHVQHFEVIVAV